MCTLFEVYHLTELIRVIKIILNSKIIYIFELKKNSSASKKYHLRMTRRESLNFLKNVRKPNDKITVGRHKSSYPHQSVYVSFVNI